MKLVVFEVVVYCSLVLLLVAKGTEGQTYGKATFNIRGITGYITFRPIPNGMTVMTNISGTNANHTWHVHTLPVDGSLPPAMRCSNDNIGGHFDPFGAVQTLGSNYGTYCNMNNQTACEVGDLSGKLGRLSSGAKTYNETTGNLTLFGTNGIIGRSIKIHGSEDVCATIVSSTEEQGDAAVTMLQASFTYPVGGTVYMRQVMGERAIIFGKLYWVNTTGATMNHRWSIHMNQTNQYYREGKCDGIGNRYNPFNIDTSVSNNCDPNNLNTCVVGDLSGKHGNINIPSQPAPYNADSFFFQDSHLNLTGTNSVSGRSLIIYSTQSNAVLACAPLVQVEMLSVRTAGGPFTASQTSRFAPTLITTTYSPYGLRVFSSALAPNSLCKEAFMAGRSRVYNPHSAPPLDGSSGTPDRYPVGNFSIKYRSFSQSGANKVAELPIHGYETISGHSLGYMRRERGSTMHTCSSMWPQYPSGSNIKMAKATFNTTVTGAIYFIQRSFGNGVFGSTHVIVDIWYTNSSRKMTIGHNWHIHERPPVYGQQCVAAIGGHFNPFNVDLDNNYGTECTPFAPLRCESGDLSGKHLKINIGAASPNRPTYTYTDNNLHLWGPANYSIINRSVGLHLPASAGGTLFDCGPIREVVFSSRDISVSLPYNSSFDRTDFVAKLTHRVKGASPSDVLMVKQEMTTDSSGNTGCVSATLRTFGGSSDEADDTMAGVESSFATEFPDSECDTDAPSGSDQLLLPSILLLLFSFILATAAAN